MRFPVVLSLILVFVSAQKEISQKFLGKFELTSSEKFDEYLAAKGVGWFVRKMIQVASVTKVFEKGSKPKTFRFKNLTSKKDTDYDNIELTKTFEAEGLDSTKHRITFDFDESRGMLLETHERIETEGAKPETYEYFFEDDTLVMVGDLDGEQC
ncbi:hypothetical protein QR680_017431 [Steinernema hermaphroditum]|uniref:Cytosolic fatty-acid binding proteins domain-containing protein n=1 Tax=Steinernema hermaphroditum TaxID=289476 RepID=A0AA39HGP1_9BILA|nr:hypothetical protein QR680_017431 [Steinernema hermaphroditum]